MCRVLIRISVLAFVLAASPLAISDSASAGPSEMPLLTSPALASPVTIHWTPGLGGALDAGAGGNGQGDGHGHDHGHGDGQGKGHGGAGDGSGAGGQRLVQFVTRAAGACDALAGKARVIASFADATTGDFSDAVGDGTYCYWIAVTDGSALAVSHGLTVVVATGAVAVVAKGSPAVPAAVTPSSGAVAVDKVPPPSPGTISFSLARRRAGRIPVTVRWTNPAVADLDHVELLINRNRAPRSRLDGHLAYRGLAHAFVLNLRAGETTRVALYAVDHSGNVSAAARTVVSLAALVPMRPMSGGSVHAAPLLTWEARKGAAYYNLQVFRRGKRVLVAWPRRASFRFPASELLPGTYVWFVWPAVRRTGAAPRFTDLIGRATFRYLP
jgi:hypothetical protein